MRLVHARLQLDHDRKGLGPEVPGTGCSLAYHRTYINSKVKRQFRVTSSPVTHGRNHSSPLLGKSGNQFVGCRALILGRLLQQSGTLSSTLLCRTSSDSRVDALVVEEAGLRSRFLNHSTNVIARGHLQDMNAVSCLAIATTRDAQAASALKGCMCRHAVVRAVCAPWPWP